jgi:hypothetical protein
MRTPRSPCKFNAKTVVEVRETVAGEVLLWHGGRTAALRKIKRLKTSAVRVEKGETPGESKRQNKPAAALPGRRSYGRDVSVHASGSNAAD